VTCGELDEGRYRRFLTLRDEAELSKQERRARAKRRGREIALASRQRRKAAKRGDGSASK
jgi:hypothetical protein